MLRAILVLIMLAALAALPACDTLNIGGGLTGIDFNVTPIGGSDRTTDEGALFNFETTFAAGSNTLGFQDVSGVSRTYYTDSNAAPDRFWSDITNDHPGVPNTVVVE